ncbi:MAG: L,D-transpeptidase family protein [Sulfurimonas sp.]|nr:L,D-transpeptidase family protein [Sulfurimonas sp.]
MIKTFLILLSFEIYLFASQQIILVVADDFQTPKANLLSYEDGKKVFDTVAVNIGRNGLAWGLGEVELTKKRDEPLKYEGDGKSPAGIFKLTDIYGYKKESNFKMPYLYASEKLICVDESDSLFYNHLIQMNGDEKSFEYMKRKDGQYELGIVVAHNKNAVTNRGSCIFLHIKKSEEASTAGCSAMRLDEIQKISSWLDKSKNPILIQIPKSSSKEIIKLYPELKESELLQEED